MRLEAEMTWGVHGAALKVPMAEREAATTARS